MFHRILITIIVAVAVLAALTGCNMMHGLGEDIEAFGEELQAAAEE